MSAPRYRLNGVQRPEHRRLHRCVADRVIWLTIGSVLVGGWASPARVHRLHEIPIRRVGVNAVVMGDGVDHASLAASFGSTRPRSSLYLLDQVVLSAPIA